MVQTPSASVAPKHSTIRELVLFLSIPLTVILLVVGVIVVPSQLARPKYDFVYSSCNSYNCSSAFSIDSGGHVVETNQTNELYSGYAGPASLYYHDVKANASRKISAADANRLRLDTTNVSPDGYILQRGDTSSSGFLFWGYSSDYGWYLSHGSKHKVMNLADQNNYSSSAQFLGWVEP